MMRIDAERLAELLEEIERKGTCWVDHATFNGLVADLADARRENARLGAEVARLATLAQQRGEECVAECRRNADLEDALETQRAIVRDFIPAGNEAMRYHALLCRLEWVGVGTARCPVCAKAQEDGHADDCEMKRCLELGGRRDGA